MFQQQQVIQQGSVAHRISQEENSARLAWSNHIVETRGAASRRLPEPILFEVGFTEPPHLATGVAIVDDPDPELGWVPEASSGVWLWERNVKGQYIGAYIYVLVRSATPALIQHHLSFSGVAYKDLGQEANTEAQLLTPRTTNFGGF